MRKIDCKYPEILAPCGSYEALVAAVAAGADAVYLSGQRFGARKSATNFSEEEIDKAIKYAHDHGVRVYCTVNTLIKENEIHDFLEWTDYLYGSGIDALILQDSGMAVLLKERYPYLELHGSTQMTAHSLYDFKQLKAMGFSRVVAAREMHIDEIAKVKESCDIEVEVFFHGALCICYSGQCLMSSLIGGRSGNRGSCAQSCRQLYTLNETSVDSKNAAISPTGFDQAVYHLSTKDLETLPHLEKNHLQWIDSIKIEGRMKRPEYVYTITAAYKKVVLGLYDENEKQIKEAMQLLDENRRIFSRGGSKGLLLSPDASLSVDTDLPGNRGVKIGQVHCFDLKKQQLTINTRATLKVNDEIIIKRGTQIFGARVETIKQEGANTVIPFKHQVLPGDIVYRVTDDALLQSVRERYRVEQPKYELSGVLTLEVGKVATLTVTEKTLLGDELRTITVLGDRIVEIAQKQPITESSAMSQISKLGGTPYQLTQFALKSDGTGMVPASELNALRRLAIEKLFEMRHDDLSQMPKRQQVLSNLQGKQSACDSEGGAIHKVESLEIWVSVQTIEQLKEVMSLPIDGVYCEDLMGLQEIATTFESYQRAHIRPRLKRLVTDSDKTLEALCHLRKQGFKSALVGSYGGVALCELADIAPLPDWSLNVFNSESVKYYEHLGAEAVTVSLELNRDEITEMAARTETPLEVVCFGKIPSMVMKHCINPCAVKACESNQLCTVKRKFWLVDKTGARFEAIQTNGITTLFNSSYLLLADETDAMIESGISRVRLEFTDESPQFIRQITGHCIDAFSGSSVAYGRLKSLADQAYQLSPTKGHFKRGVI